MNSDAPNAMIAGLEKPSGRSTCCNRQGNTKRENSKCCYRLSKDGLDSLFEEFRGFKAFFWTTICCLPDLRCVIGKYAGFRVDLSNKFGQFQDFGWVFWPRFANWLTPTEPRNGKSGNTILGPKNGLLEGPSWSHLNNLPGTFNASSP